VLEGGKVWLSWIVHVETYLLNCIGDVGPSEGQILKGTCKAAEIHGISDRGTISKELRINIHRC
jgi:hypothetical protein